MKRSERERLQVALDAAGMGTFVWYPRQDYAEADRRMMELFALPPHGVLSLAAALASMIHPGDRQQYGDAVAAALDPAGDHELNQEIRVDRGDGSFRWVAVTARAMFEGDPPEAERLVGVAADVTQRRAIEEALRSTEERRAFLLDLTDRLRVVTDPVEVQSLAVDALGRHLTVSRASYLAVTSGPAGDWYTIEGGYHAAGIDSVAGRYRADDFGGTLFDELRAGRTLTVTDVTTDDRLTAQEIASYPTLGVRAFTAVPLIKNGRHVAALVLHQATPRQWSDTDIALTEEVAERTWAAVERATAEAALRASEAQFRQVVDVAPQLIWVARADGVLELANRHWSAVTGVPVPAGDSQDRRLLAEAVHPAERAAFLDVWDASRTGGSDFEHEARLRHYDGAYRWYLIRVAGFQDGAGGVVKWFGVATDIDERRRADQRARAEQARARELEHRIALQLQRALLPAGTVSRPDLTIAARYEAGSATLEVGGDWYDTLELPDGSIALTVGDVVGHGLTAATAMGKLRVATGALAPHATGPGELLSHLDGFAAGNPEIGFATACYATFDPATGVLRHATAGHPPMLVVTDDGRTRWLMAGRSAPISGRPVGPRPDAVEILEPGALLLLYSDGLVERRRETITVGLERLEQAAAKLRYAPVEDFCDSLLVALGVDEHRDDDVVLLCLRAPARTADTFQQTLAADAYELARLRHSLRAWRRSIQPPDRGETDLLLAVNEAFANAVEHAYRDAPAGPVEVTVRRDPDGSYLVRVRDSGTWRPPADTAGLRGRGLTIIRDVARDFECHHTAAGTLVSFRIPTIGVKS
jgi:PAS domain S-box-containing protein